jgi:DNA-binding NarL/FixJ family response regulator
MTPTKRKKKSDRTPRVLLVDAHPAAMQATLLGSDVACRVYPAGSLREARELLAHHSFDVMVADRALPDGDGAELVGEVHKAAPATSAILTSAGDKVDDAIAAIRAGASDFLPKSKMAEQLPGCLKAAIGRSAAATLTETRVRRMKRTLKKLSQARRMVGKKVDLLCNDLVSAYGEIARQMDVVRTREDFRKSIENPAGLEQLLCHAMDWIMRKIGYSNTAVWLATESTFQLGAYIKYTQPSTPELAEAIRAGVVQRALRDGMVRISGEDAKRQLSPGELKYMENNCVLAVNCSYLGESLAVLVLFRNASQPFTGEDAEAIRLIAPIFAIALSAAVKGGEDGEEGEGLAEGTDTLDPESDTRREGEKKTDADWWKRGETPPF